MINPMSKLIRENSESPRDKSAKNMNVQSSSALEYGSFSSPKKLNNIQYLNNKFNFDHFCFQSTQPKNSDRKTRHSSISSMNLTNLIPSSTNYSEFNIPDKCMHLDTVQKHADVNAWLNNTCLNTSMESLLSSSDTSSTSTECASVFGSDISHYGEVKFERKCKDSPTLDENGLRTSCKELLQLHRDFEEMNDKMSQRFPHIRLPRYSIYTVKEGTKMVRVLFGLKNLKNESEVPLFETRDRNLPDFSFLSSYKKALSMNLKSRLNILRSQYSLLEEQDCHNDKIFQCLISAVQNVCSVREHDLLLVHVEESRKLSFLLVGLACRLVRTEEAITWDKETEDLEKRREGLIEQLNEGKLLKQKTDKRANRLFNVIEKYLGMDRRMLFEKYLNSKIKICIDMREAEEFQRLLKTLSDFVDKISDNNQAGYKIK